MTGAGNDLGVVNMKRILFIFAVILSAATFAFSQTKKTQFVIEPTDQVMLLVSSSPECPVLIEDPIRFLNIGAPWDMRYKFQITNRAQKPIVSVSVVHWTSLGTGGTLAHFTKLANGELAPGVTQSINGITVKDEVIPLTDELRNRIDLQGPLKAVVVLMVERVQFSDGSVYSAEKNSKALSRYFESLDTRANSKTSTKSSNNSRAHRSQ
jgi:hypothetical protein